MRRMGLAERTCLQHGQANTGIMRGNTYHIGKTGSAIAL